jgi:hypothetical protein
MYCCSTYSSYTKYCKLRLVRLAESRLESLVSLPNLRVNPAQYTVMSESLIHIEQHALQNSFEGSQITSAKKSQGAPLQPLKATSVTSFQTLCGCTRVSDSDVTVRAAPGALQSI